MDMVPSPNAPVAFTFPDTAQEVRSVMINGEPWWVATDVATVLELGNLHSSLAQLDDDERSLHSVESGQRSMSIVSEPGLYSLILRSRKPQAKAFKRWITHEVIPQIRRTGSFSPARLSNRDLARMVIEEADRADFAERRVLELEPAARSWSVLADAKGDFSLRDAAHILNRDPAISTGQQRLMKLVRALGMVDRNDIPYAKHATHLVERPRTFTHPHSGEETLARPQVRITVRGLQYLHGKLGGVARLRLGQLPIDADG